MSILKACDFLESKLGPNLKPDVAIMLGSGLGEIADAVKKTGSVPYREIPGFASATVAGHHGTLIAGELGGKKILLFSGRVHYYEGHSMDLVVYPVRLASFLGIKKIILTSAVGSMNPKIKPGDAVVIKDHINFMGMNPLRGHHEGTYGERFPDMSACYSERLRELALSAAKKNKISAHEGIYFAVSGPSYETPSEIEAFRKLGGDVVGMSTAPEAIAANQMGMEILGLSYAANFSAGLSKKPLNHADVLECGRKAAGQVSLLIQEVLKKI